MVGWIHPVNNQLRQRPAHSRRQGPALSDCTSDTSSSTHPFFITYRWSLCAAMTFEIASSNLCGNRNFSLLEIATSPRGNRNFPSWKSQLFVSVRSAWMCTSNSTDLIHWFCQHVHLPPRIFIWWLMKFISANLKSHSRTFRVDIAILPVVFVLARDCALD